MAANVEMPMYKALQQMAAYRSHLPINQPLEAVDTVPPEPPNVLVDGVSFGGPSDGKQKPLARHVIVKDLNKIGSRLKFEHPKTGVFAEKAPMGLYALFDGQSCAGTPGPLAAEFCARNFHLKLLERLARLPEDPEAAAIVAALRGSFEDLDEELLTNQPDVVEGCGAAVALLIGERVFTAVLGRCRAVLGELTGGVCRPGAGSLIGNPLQIDGERLRAINAAGGIIVGDSSGARLQHPSGALSSVSRSLGDRIWKGAKGGASQGLPLITCAPEVQIIFLRGTESHPYLLLVASPVAASLTPQELVDAASEFQVQPRAACGDIVMRSSEAHAGAAALAQCTAVQLCFLPPRQTEDKKRPAGASAPPASKKAKTGAAAGGVTQSVRLRHILLRYNDGPQPPPKEPEKGKKVKTRQEAEAVLRRVISDLRKAFKEVKKTPKDATELVQATSKQFQVSCKEHSECDTAKKGGIQCGDLGWVTVEDRARMGGSFKEVVDVLQAGQYSDIALSDQGLHLVQRIA